MIPHLCRFFGLTPQPQPVPFFNQENVPCTLPGALWNHAWTMQSQTQPVQPQVVVLFKFALMFFSTTGETFSNYSSIQYYKLG